MSWDNDDLQDAIANFQRAELIRKQDQELEELKKLNSQKEAARSQPVSSRPQERELKCPQCAEWIKAEAKICKYCRSEVAEAFAKILADEKKKAAAELAAQKKREATRQAAEQKREAARHAQAIRMERERLERIEAAKKVKIEEKQARKQKRKMRRAKFFGWLKSLRGLVSVGVALCLIALSIFGIMSYQVQQAQNKIIFAENLVKACGKLETTLGHLAQTGNISGLVKKDNSGLAKQLAIFESAGGAGSIEYEGLRNLSSALALAKTSSLNNWSSKVKLLEGLHLNKLITSCDLTQRFFFSGSSSNDPEDYGSTDVYLSSVCSTNPKTIYQFQIRTTDGDWESHTLPVPFEKSWSCDNVSPAAYRGIAPNLNFGLVDQDRLHSDYRLKYYTKDNSYFSLRESSDYSNLKQGATVSCANRDSRVAQVRLHKVIYLWYDCTTG